MRTNFLVFFATISLNVFCQINRDTSINKEKASFSTFIGVEYDSFRPGQKYQGGGMGGTYSEGSTINKAYGYATILGVQFAFPVSQNFKICIEGTTGIVKDNFNYSSEFSSQLYSGSSLYNYNTLVNSNKAAILTQTFYGKKIRYYFYLGSFLMKENAINTNGSGHIQSSEYDYYTHISYDKDTFIYNNDIKTNFKVELGFSTGTGVKFPLKKSRSWFMEARFEQSFKDAIENPNLKITHILINCGITFSLRK
jgi:hypothetical protein